MDKMPPSGTRTHNPPIISQEHKPLHHRALCVYYCKIKLTLLTSEMVLVIFLHHSGSYLLSCRYPSSVSLSTFFTAVTGNFLTGPSWYVGSSLTGPGLAVSWGSSMKETVLTDLVCGTAKEPSQQTLIITS